MTTATDSTEQANQSPDGSPPAIPATPLGVVSGADDVDPRPPTRYVALADLVLEYGPWKNPRSHTGLDDESLAALARSINDNMTSAHDNGQEQLYAGIRAPLEVVMVRAANGRTVNLVIDGQRRHMAVTSLGIPDIKVPVVDLEPDPVDFTAELAAKYLMIALDTVGTRAPLSSYELSESAVRLRESKNAHTGKEYTLAEIATPLHRSESWVSKILSARRNATPVLLAKWRRGEITDEQFKDLATAKDPEQQQQQAAKVAEARQSGDRAEARTLAKEQKETARSATPKTSNKGDKAVSAPKKGKADPGRTTDNGPRQSDAPVAPPRKAPSLAVIEDVIGMGEKNPPTHDYVKGIMDGIKYDRGRIDSTEFARPWGVYLQHVQGTKETGKPAKAGKAKHSKKK